MPKVLDLLAIRTASTVLKRAHLPASDNGQFTPGDSAPKAGEEAGQHTVKRTVRGIRTLKSGPVGFLPRKGQVYAVKYNAETGKWDSTERLTGKALTNANAAIAKESAQVKAAKAADKPKATPKPKTKAKVKAKAKAKAPVAAKS